MERVEWNGPLAPADALLPSLLGESWQRHRAWLEPAFWDTGTGQCRAWMQTWVLRTAGRTVVVDTGIGNHERRQEP